MSRDMGPGEDVIWFREHEAFCSVLRPPASHCIEKSDVRLLAARNKQPGHKHTRTHSETWGLGEVSLSIRKEVSTSCQGRSSPGATVVYDELQVNQGRFPSETLQNHAAYGSTSHIVEAARCRKTPCLGNIAADAAYIWRARQVKIRVDIAGL